MGDLRQVDSSLRYHDVKLLDNSSDMVFQRKEM
jgi:hypothetical protein